MPGAGHTHGPPATKNAGGSRHRISRNNRHSLRDGVTAYTRSPRSTGLVSLRRLRFIIRRLDPSVGRSGPRDFAVRMGRVRQLRPMRPSHPAPTFPTIAKRPSCGAGQAKHTRILYSEKQNIFRGRAGLVGQIRRNAPRPRGHCEERSDEAIQTASPERFWIASLRSQ